MKLKQMLKVFKFKWSVHGLGLVMAIAFLIGASALMPGGLLQSSDSTRVLEDGTTVHTSDPPGKDDHGPPVTDTPPP